MAKSLLGPLVIADPGGLTLLTAQNVALVPEGLAAALARLPGPVPGRNGDVPFLAFVRGRHGLVGCRGRIGPDGSGLTLRGLEAFGARSGLMGFGLELSAAIQEPGRFEVLPSVDPGNCAGTGTGVEMVVEGLVAGGLRSIGAEPPCPVRDGP